MVFIIGVYMKRLIKEWCESPSKFIEDMCNIKLSHWQKIIVDNIDKIQDLHISYPMHNNRLYYFRTLRELEKYLEKEIIEDRI